MQIYQPLRKICLSLYAMSVRKTESPSTWCTLLGLRFIQNGYADPDKGVQQYKCLPYTSKATNTTSSFKVQISISDLNIRKGPGTNYAATGKFTGKGVFTIVETKQGTGSAKGWGKLKSGVGWISLDYATKI